MANVSAFTGAMPVIPGGTVELGYLPKTSTVPVNAGSGSQVSVVGPLTVVCDGSPIMVEFYCEEAAAATTAGAYLIASLWVDGAETTRTMGVVYAGATGSNHGETLHAVQRIIPAAGSHTIEIKGWSSAAGNFYAAAGGTAAYAPMWLRVSKIVNQNDGLKPFWTPPVVTQLPSQATVGDQVIYAADATNGVYWHLTYDGLGTYPWKFIGGGQLFAEVITQQATTVTTGYTNLATVGPSVTIPLAGDYDYRISARVQNPGSSLVTYTGLAVNNSVNGNDATLIYDTTVGTHEYAQMLERRKTGLAANDVLKMMYYTSGGTSYWTNRSLYVTPIRVKAA
jgi:hypothetical protein